MTSARTQFPIRERHGATGADDASGAGEPAPGFTRPGTTPGPMLPRVLGTYEGDRPGPLTIIVAGVHGNEGRGVEAARWVLADLDERRPPFRGRLVALTGNRTALAAGVRHIDRDMNRAFPYGLSEIRAGEDGWPPILQPIADSVEARERDGLLDAIREHAMTADPDEEAIVIDLHTFSSDGPPFCVFADTIRNRRFSEAWPLPRILGLAEEVPGTLIEYLTAAGFIAIVVETGRHDDPRSARLHEASVRLALVRAGHVDAAAMPGLDEDRAALAAATTGLPRQLDVQHRQPVAPDDGFVMRPGWANFDRVAGSDELADTSDGPVRAPRGGRMLLPLYQSQGSDGFFIARPIGGIWLALSDLLRRLGVPKLAGMLPGVHRHESRPNALVADRSIARWLAVDVFHLLGFRRLASDGRRLEVARRQHDRRRPSRLRP